MEIKRVLKQYLDFLEYYLQTLENIDNIRYNKEVKWIKNTKP